MGKTTAMGNEVLNLIFNNVSITGIGASEGPAIAAFWVSLHTSDPGNGGNQATSETTYRGYARVSVMRNPSGFTVLGSSVSFTSNVDFGACTSLPGSPITHFGIGDSRTGEGKLRYSGTLTPSIQMEVGATPRVDTSANLIKEE